MEFTFLIWTQLFQEKVELTIFCVHVRINEDRDGREQAMKGVGGVRTKKAAAKLTSMVMAVILICSVAIRSVVAISISDETAVDWIDRVDDTQEVNSVYHWLVEATDNDGFDDHLISDDYFVDDGEVHGVRIATSKGRALSEEEFNRAKERIIAHYSEIIQVAGDAFDRDHPEVFWLANERRFDIQGSYYVDYYGGYQYTIDVRYLVKAPGFDARAEKYRSAEAIRAAIAERNLLVGQIVAGTEAMEPYEKLRYFNQRLTVINEYNTGVDLSNIDNDSSECISALRGSVGKDGPVCEGYAKAFKVLCDRVEIPCVLVDGMATDGQSSEAHMWNAVQLEGEWYGVDVTWNDPIGGTGGALSGSENEYWFLVGSGTVFAGMPFSRSHPVSNQVSQGGISFGSGPKLSESAFVPKEKPGNEVIGCKTWTLVDMSYSAQCQSSYGELKDAEYWRLSDYIEVTAGQSYRYVGLTEGRKDDFRVGSVCIYDKDRKLIGCILESGDYLDGYEFIVPEGTHYIRCCYSVGSVTLYGLQYLEGDTHLWGSTVVPPNCVDQGYTAHQCSKCGEEYRDEYVSANGHSYGDWVMIKQEGCDTDGEYRKYCKNCDNSIADFVPVVGHDYGAWYVTKEETDDENGEKQRKCKICDHVETEVICTVRSFFVMHLPNRLYYCTGEDIDWNGIEMELVFNDGRRRDVRIEECAVSGYDPNQPGMQRVMVEHRGFTAFINVTVGPPLSTENSMEVSTDRQTEESAEASTEVPTEAPTEMPTEASTEIPTETPAEIPTEASTEMSTETPAEVPTETSAEMPTETPTEMPTEASTQIDAEETTKVPEEETTEEPDTESVLANDLKMSLIAVVILILVCGIGLVIKRKVLSKER